MNVYQGIENFQFNSKNILTIGTFDGVHLGHKYLLDRVNVLSKKHNGVASVVTFDPHPQLVVQKEGLAAIKLLTSLDEKVEILGELGIQNLYIIPFDLQFARLSPNEFILTYLKKLIGLVGVVVGHDHGFGNAREGNYTTLLNAFAANSVWTERLGQFTVNNQLVSSSVIRRLLTAGKIAQANELLGYNYSVTKQVIMGNKRGRELGFPTANLNIADSDKLIPGTGVYATKCTLNQKTYIGMANIGTRPTFSDEKTSFEVHLIDFDGDIYNQEIKVEFIIKIRDQIKFNDASDLVKQLKNDKKNIKSILS
ncbi:MAG: bifunctional riboflavin kinase/FAD synthetase [Deferribacteres bacterium]|nr:bifunctional riboflavin kinase/FAD synthetase [candidate division KSB1 bacterium]MCB9501341.1 bifunctional riboflavin kinase/FAD synthetase [Deferribacteres bacterium]